MKINNNCLKYLFYKYFKIIFDFKKYKKLSKKRKDLYE